MAVRNLLCVSLVASSLLVTACTGIGVDPNTMVVDFVCDPQGATLYQIDKVNIGSCPTTLKYQITDEARARGYMELRGITAVWVSGASSSVNLIRADLQKGLRQNFRFDRPRSMPNYDVDANYALQLEKIRIMRAQAEAQKAQADAQQAEATIAALNSAIAAANSAYTAPRNNEQHCTTTYLGNTAHTDCY
jgi:hypothetical protein